MKLSVVFEEVAAYQYKQNKEQERSHGGSSKAGLRDEFEEDFSFGEEDNTDYWHFKDDGVDIEE